MNHAKPNNPNFPTREDDVYLQITQLENTQEVEYYNKILREKSIKKREKNTLKRNSKSK